ncbi:hypothetical protein K431DRAFT_304032 [Polychaeton citri CBS 116435]|uniref:Uncharacterized protein n=1 Tax=Polychaeton citri CBS 116435 TaxID=1314669 RepID=A0A9P4UPT1_9PEZI|nr:hypothetical protein K431DRAFT_304032 [Polychaeton citri CBS 116435]
MDCFQDFCLACDSACSEGPYCSQACRLADIERSSGSTTPTSPSYVRTPSSKRAETSYFSQSLSQDPRALTPSSSRSSLSSNSSSPNQASSQSLSYQAQHQLQGYYSSFDQTRAAKRRSSTR